MPVSIRRGGPDDIETAVSIYARASAARRGGREVPGWRLDQVRATMDRPETWLYLANDGGVPVGMASAMPSSDDRGVGAALPGLCYLDSIFVVPERWGEGIGPLLLDTVMDDATAGVSRASTSGHTRTTSALTPFTAVEASA